MTTGALGTPQRPLRVAVIGSGPSGFYAAEHVLSQDGVYAQVDMYDRLPTPFGLVRGGVAPDHQKIKSVTRMYDKIAAHPEFRFFGNVDVGRDVGREDLRPYYHAVIYAVGARADRRMGIPNEHLPGSHCATDFVGWYNAHPDYTNLQFDLSGRTALVVGNGNVAMDVARILAAHHDYLAHTDIADHALDVLAESQIEEIILLGRRGPAQAAFTTKELREFGQIPRVSVVVDPQEIRLDALTQLHIEQTTDRTRDANIEVMREFSARAPEEGSRTVRLRFLASPVALVGTERVEAIVVERNELRQADDGSLRPRGTGDTETIPVDLVFRAIGYQGTPIHGLPFDDRSGTIPHVDGRVVFPERKHEPVPGEYVVGWIKRGPQGVIGTNKPDSQATVDSLIDDMRAGILDTEVPDRTVLETFIIQRRKDLVTYADWQAIDEIERSRGQAKGRPRVKFPTTGEMIAALGDREASPTS